MIRIYLLFFGCFFIAKSLMGQDLERFRIHPKGWGIKWKPEINFSGGYSLPFGKYAALTDLLTDKKGAAQGGFYGEFRFIQRNPSMPLWNLECRLGYMKHNIPEQSILQTFSLAAFEAKPWDMFYILPGMSFRGGKRLCFELGAAAGVLVYNGWNARRGVINKLNQLDVYEWNFKRSVAGTLRFNAQVGFKINNRCMVFAEAACFLGRGSREGIRYQKVYKVDTLHQVAIEPPLSSQESTILYRHSFTTLNLGLGFRYVLYKYLHDPNVRFWNYY